ncbi:MAG: hypothetical protein HKN80_01870 [Acidimicrobiia bacterium]|nr:hypothetical protein [Acidimicrobiia bacterium]
MRQIHPRTSYPAMPPAAVPTAIDPASHVTVDLRDIAGTRHPSLSAEDRLRAQLADVRRAVDTVMEQLAELIDRRENLKVALGTIVSEPPAIPAGDDQTVVPWGFYDDEL